jgi:hypothetical protein
MNVTVPAPTSFETRNDVFGFGGPWIGPGCRLTVKDTSGGQHSGTVGEDGTFTWDEER